MENFEIPTFSFGDQCSTAELHPRFVIPEGFEPPHLLVRSEMFYPIKLRNHCYPPEIRTPIKWTKTTCPAVRREGNMVGNAGLEPATP